MLLQCSVAGFRRPDPDSLFDGIDKYFAVADLAGLRFFADHCNYLVSYCIGNDDLDLDLRDKSDLIFSAPVQLNMALLSAESLDFGHGHTLDSHRIKGIFYLVKFEWFYYRLNLFHAAS